MTVETASFAEDIVFIPTEPMHSGDMRARVHTRPMEDGRQALLVYSSLDLLTIGYGESQPWIAVPVEELETLHRLVRFDVIAVNVEVPEDWRRVAPSGAGEDQ